MKKATTLLFGTRRATNAEWSPHRSTLSTDRKKYQASRSEPDSMLFQAMSLQKTPAALVPLSKHQHIMTDDGEDPTQRVRCVSEDVFTCQPSRPLAPTFPDELTPGLMVRHISFDCKSEIQEPLSQAGVVVSGEESPQRQKRRRNRGGDVEEHTEDRDLFKTNKRRRLHERKKALDASDFDAILSQIA